MLISSNITQYFQIETVNLQSVAFRKKLYYSLLTPIWSSFEWCGIGCWYNPRPRPLARPTAGSCLSIFAIQMSSSSAAAKSVFEFLRQKINNQSDWRWCIMEMIEMFSECKRFMQYHALNSNPLDLFLFACCSNSVLQKRSLCSLHEQHGLHR